MKNILIVGSGVAGLSAGIYAQLNGFSAFVCERHSIAGGCLTSWKRKGYHIDNCIHWLTGTNPDSDEYSMWRELGVLDDKVGLYKRDSLFSYKGASGSLSAFRDLNRFKDSLLTLSPDNKHEAEKYIRLINSIRGLLGLAGENNNERYSVPRIIKELPSILRYHNLSARELADRFSSDTVKGFLVSFLPEGFGSLALAFVLANFCSDNGDLPMGGSEAMAKSLVERFRSLGGKLLFNKDAVKINVNNGAAESAAFSDGSVIEADYYILTSDPAVIFSGMLDAEMPKHLSRQYKKYKLPRFSAVQCAFGCELEHPGIDGDITVDIPAEYRGAYKADYMLIRCDSHESYAPEGRSLIQTMVYCDEKTALELIDLRDSDRAAYKQEKARIGEITKAILVSAFPHLEGKLDCLDVWTPATYNRYTASETGSFMSFAFTKKHLPLRISGRLKGIKNVLLAGQWLQMPGGLPIAAITGKNAVRDIMKIESKNKR